MSFVAAAILALHAPGVLGAQVRFERTGYRLTSLGERLAVSGRVVDARRRPVSNANIRWRVADPTIASVTPQGVVVSRRVGYTKLWAVAGNDSASALILVDQWAANFDFSPATVRLEARGAKVPLRIQVRDAGGFPIAEQARKAVACRSINERIARLAETGEVVARANGVTYIRCTDRGIADSVRVEVRQRPLRALIADKLTFGAKTVGDSFRIRIAAFDRAGDEIKDIQATWASLSPTVVSVDPLTGWGRSVGHGEAKVVGQVGDVTDTLVIQVALAPGMLAPPVAGADSGAVGLAGTGGPALQMQSLYLAEGDEASLTITARDAAGQTVANPDITLRSNDTSIVAILPGRKVVAKKTGIAYVIGDFGAIRDSTQVSVRAKATAASTAASTGPTTVAFVRPTFKSDSILKAYKDTLEAAKKAIREASRVAEYSGRILSLSAFGGQSIHATQISASVREERSGAVFGGIVEAAPHRTIRLSGQLRKGTLTSNLGDVGEALDLLEAEADLMIWPARVFGFGGGYVLRSQATPTATQQWKFPRATIMTKLPFVGDGMTAVIGFSALPGAKYTGHADSTGIINPDPFSFAGEAGLEFHKGVVSGGITYYVERFTFPAVLGEKRRDQFSTIRIRFGLQRGRDR